MEVSTTGFWSHSEWNLKSSLRFTNRALVICDPSTPPLPDASLPSPASMLLAHSAPAMLPFFLFLKMAKHSPGLKPVPWGDSPSSCDSFPYFLQVSAQNPPLPWGFPDHSSPHPLHSASFCFTAWALWHVIHFPLRPPLQIQFPWGQELINTWHILGSRFIKRK